MNVVIFGKTRLSVLDFFSRLSNNPWYFNREQKNMNGTELYLRVNAMSASFYWGKLIFMHDRTISRRDNVNSCVANQKNKKESSTTGARQSCTLHIYYVIPDVTRSLNQFGTDSWKIRPKNLNLHWSLCVVRKYYISWNLCIHNRKQL